MNSKAIVITLFAVAAASTLHAQKKGVVNVVQVNDRRTSGSFAQLMIALEIPNIKGADVAATRVVIRSATDDKGRVLIPQEEPKLEANYRRSSGPPDTRPVTVTVTLNSPERTATTIPDVSGDIELYMPSKDSNAVATIPKFMTQSGKMLSNRALKANGVEITLLSKSQLEAEKKKQAEKKRESYSKEGYEGESLEQAVASFLESFFTPEANDVVVLLKDPNDRIQEIEYVDASGEPQRVIRREESGLIVLSTWGTAPGADTTLRVNLKTPKSMVKQSFALKDVKLP
jgi:hypothetical protein